MELSKFTGTVKHLSKIIILSVSRFIVLIFKFAKKTSTNARVLFTIRYPNRALSKIMIFPYLYNQILERKLISNSLPANFESNKYLELNKDVSAAIESGVCQSAEIHYIKFGQYEGRSYNSAVPHNEELSENSLHILISPIEIAVCERRWEDAFFLLSSNQAEFAKDLKILSLVSDEAIRQFGHAASLDRYRRPDICCSVMQQLTNRFPDQTHWWWIYIETLCILGRIDEAEKILYIQQNRFPNCANFIYNAGFIETQRRNWKTAINHYTRYLSSHPEDTVAQERLAQARMESEEASTGNSGLGLLEMRRQVVGLTHDDEIRSLLLGFESLGSDCEFGLVQRRFGAEPLALFRWNSTTLNQLIECLSADLIGLGEAKNTVMLTWEDHEYFLEDKRWGFRFHTFTSRHEVEVDKFYPTMCKRLVYLREKFKSDLRDSDKAFVFKATEFSIEKYKSLHKSLNRHRQSKLIVVTSTIELNKYQIKVPRCPSLYELDDGIYVGVISDFGNKPEQWDIQFEEWVELCRFFVRSDFLNFAIATKA